MSDPSPAFSGGVSRLVEVGSGTRAITWPEGAIIEQPYDPAKDRETTRGSIALKLVWTLVGVIGGAMLMALLTTGICSWKNACTAETANLAALKVILEVVLTPLIGLVGAVTASISGRRAERASARPTP